MVADQPTPAENYLAVHITYVDPDYTPPDPDSGPGGIAFWFLKVDDLNHQITRQASIIPLPFGIKFTGVASVKFGGSDHPFLNRPTAWCLDLGLIQETVSLRGTINDYEENETIPTIAQLDEIVRCVNTGSFSSLQGGELQFSKPLTISVDLGPNAGSSTISPTVRHDPTYRGTVLTYTAKRTGGQPRWEWSMNLGVTDWDAPNFAFQS